MTIRPGWHPRRAQRPASCAGSPTWMRSFSSFALSLMTMKTPERQPTPSAAHPYHPEFNFRKEQETMNVPQQKHIRSGPRSRLFSIILLAALILGVVGLPGAQAQAHSVTHAVLSPASVDATNLVTNGDFGAGDLTGWTVIGTPYVGFPEKMVVFNGGGASAGDKIWQQVQTSASRAYLLTYQIMYFGSGSQVSIMRAEVPRCGQRPTHRRFRRPGSLCLADFFHLILQRDRGGEDLVHRRLYRRIRSGPAAGQRLSHPVEPRPRGGQRQLQHRLRNAIGCGCAV